MTPFWTGFLIGCFIAVVSYLAGMLAEREHASRRRR